MLAGRRPFESDDRRWRAGRENFFPRRVQM
jgi:hypothetical protein